jgi:L-aspartate oxidase
VLDAPLAAPAYSPPSVQTRTALWQRAGLVRDGAGLAELARDAHPLARLIGRAALARRESRGCHLRADFAETDARLDGRHLVLREGEPDGFQSWA